MLKGRKLALYNIGILIIAIGAIGLIIFPENPGIRISAICTGIGMMVAAVGLIIPDSSRRKRQGERKQRSELD